MSNVLTQDQVRLLAIEVGWSPADAKIIAAIAMVESAYSANGRSYADPDKVGDLNLVTSIWGPSYGLCQVRSLWEQKNTGLPRDAVRLSEPRFNLKSALQIFRSLGFKAWTTYNNGQYQAYLPQDYPPPNGVHVVHSGDTLIGITARYSGFTWPLLARVNGLQRPYTIYINQALQLPVWTYTVRPGDNMSNVARTQSKVTATDLAVYNNIANPNLIWAGQQLRIPHPEVLIAEQLRR